MMSRFLPPISKFVKGLWTHDELFDLLEKG